MDIKDRLNPGEERSMENISRVIEKYLEEINCFIGCLKSDEFVVNANEESIDAMFKTATEIEFSFCGEDVRELKKTLKKLYPSYNFKCCGNLVLEAFLDQPLSNERMLLYAIKKYIAIYSKDKLFILLINMLKTKKLKEDAISLLLKSKKEGVVRMLEARSIISLWEHMIAENCKNFENCVIDTVEKETTLFLHCLKLSGKSTGHLILTIILRYLNNQPDLKMWFILLNDNNIQMTSYLCSQYEEFLEGLLKFFSRYAEEECCEGKLFSWTDNTYPLNKFVDILHFLLTNDGLVGITVNEFINREISNFDSNCSFWIDIKALLN